MIWRAALVAAFAALSMLPTVGQRYIVTGDEARFAILAQDMLARGTWFDARVREQRYRNKPLLYPWAIKVLSLPGGRVTETTMQLPITVAAVTGVFLVTVLGQQLFTIRAGVGAGLITATTYAFFSHSQILLPDMLVVAFGLAALSAFWAAGRDPLDRRWLTVFYVTLALGVAAKGPMGILPLLIVGLWLLTEEGVRGLRRLGSRAGAIAFGLLTALWLVPYLVAGGRSFARGVVWEDWLSWYLGVPRPLPILNMLVVAAGGLMPWTALLGPPLLAVRRQWRNGAFRFALLAWLLPLVVVLLSNNHRARYLLPMYPGAALLIAWWLDAHGTEESGAQRVVVWLTAAAALAMIVVLALPWVDPMERELVDHFWWKATAMLAGAIALPAYGCSMLRRRAPRALVVGLALGTAVLFGVGLRVYNGAVNREQDYPRLATMIERYSQGGEVGVAGGRFFSIDFYLGRAATTVRSVPELDDWLDRPGHPLLVVTSRAWSTMRTQARGDVEVVDSMRVRGHLMFLLRRVVSPERRGPPRP
ncbi:MAG TPA: glycosyltransferase family 39 protein [Methylomirabilota bacterium]|nr:glycosyltransferase family 39 protein [Methylomirabilota bacterium]